MANTEGNSIGLGVYGGRRGAAVKNKANSDRALSKCLDVGNNYRVFFKTMTYDDDNGSGVDFFSVLGVGRSLDFNIFNNGFLAYSDSMYNYDPVVGKFTDLTNMESWSKIGRVIFEAQCQREKKVAEHEAEETAVSLGRAIDQTSLNRKLEAIELEYHGGEAADGTRINPKKNVPMSGLQVKMVTRVLVVRMLPDGRPDFKNAQYASLEISNTKLSQLENILENADYVNGDDGYLEVQYNYIGQDKAAAGRSAQFQGVPSSIRLKNTYPEEWNAKGKSLVDNLIPGSTLNEMGDLVLAKNINFRRRLSPNEIPTLFSKWAQNEVVVFSNIDYESKYTIEAAPYFLKYGLLDNYDKIKEKFESICADTGNDEDTSEKPSDAGQSIIEAASVVAPEPVVAPTPAPAPAQPTAIEQPLPFIPESNNAQAADSSSFMNVGQASKGASYNLSADDDELGDLD